MSDRTEAATLLLAIFALVFAVVGLLVVTHNKIKGVQKYKAETEQRLDSMQIQIDSVKTTIMIMTE